MQIATSPLDRVTLIQPAGRLDGASSPALEQAALAALEAGPPRLVLDMAGVDYISSAGLRVVLLAAKRARAAQGGLWICALQPGVQEVFEMSGFGKIIPLLATQADALQAAA